MQQFFDFPVTPAASFDNFIVCDGTLAACTFARRIADPAEADKLLYLHGPAGSGKSHLLKAVVRSVAPDGTMESYLSCRSFVRAGELVERFRGAPILAVDDLHLLRDDTGFRAELWEVFNEFYSSGRPVVMAGEHPPRELAQLDEHLVSRLLWGLVARLDVSDDASRRMIIRKVAEDRQVLVPADAVEYILATTGREVSELIGAFEKVYHLSMALKRKISVGLAREALSAGGGCP